MANTIDLPAGWPGLVDTLLDQAAGQRLVVLLDGGSGAGKTQLAKALRDELSAALGEVQLVSLDDVYPGWGGLAAASGMVWGSILHPDSPGHPTWDWQANRTSGWRPLDGQAPILVEGCGALSRRSAPLATTSLWYERDPQSRRERALARDGEGFRPWWDAWAVQEAVQWRAEQPWQLADIVLRGDLIPAAG